jgi:hypothetical protein
MLGVLTTKPRRGSQAPSWATFHTTFADAATSKTVEATMTVKEVELAVYNKGTTQMMWTYGGAIPGPPVRVTQGDIVDPKKGDTKAFPKPDREYVLVQGDLFAEDASVARLDGEQWTGSLINGKVFHNDPAPCISRREIWRQALIAEARMGGLGRKVRLRVSA